MATIHRALAFMILGISAILLSGYLFFNENDVGLNSIADLRFVDSLPSGFLTKFKSENKEYIYAFLELNGTFQGPLELDVSGANILLRKSNAKDGEMSISLDGGELKVENNLSLINYTGNILYDLYSNALLIEGSIKKLVLPYATFEMNGGENIYYNSSVVEYVKIENVDQDDIELKGFKGTVNIKVKGDTISYVTSNKDLKISKIKGDLVLEHGRITFKGEGIIKTDVLMTPIE